MGAGPVRTMEIERTSTATSDDSATIDLRHSVVGTLGFLAVSDGQSHALDGSRALADVVRTLDSHPDAIGVMITDAGRFVTTLSREGLARFLSKPYTQFLYLHRPISFMLETREHAPLECGHEMSVSEVICARPESAGRAALRADRRAER